jgi:hypothetical protein
MPAANGAYQEARQAREHAAALKSHLIAPSAEQVWQAVPELEAAIACLARVANRGSEEAGLGKPEPADANRQQAAAARELQALRFELGVIARTASGAAEFYRNWAQILAASASGYQPTGEPASLQPRGTISVEG